MNRGKFITIEGIDGSGTSTQSKLLAKTITELGREVHETAEPTNGPIGKLIREIFQKKPVLDKRIYNMMIANLFTADRYEHVFSPGGIRDLINKGTDVVCCRYVASNIAYQADSNLDFNRIIDMNRPFPFPDLIIYLDNPVEKSIERILERDIVEIYENTKDLCRAKDNYERILVTENVFIVDATKEIEEIEGLIKAELIRRFGF